MATDSLAVSPGVGEAVATKKINSLQHQRVIEHADRKLLTLTPTITAGAYANNEGIGGLLTFNGAFREAVTGMSVQIEEIFIMIDSAAVTPDCRLYLFGATMTNPVADKAAYTMTTADMLKLQGFQDFAAAGYTQMGQAKRFNPQRQSTPLVINWGTGNTTGAVFGLLVATGAFTPLATNALTIGLKIKAD